MNNLILLLLVSTTDIVNSSWDQDGCDREDLGCWKDKSSDRAISNGIRFKSSDKNEITDLCQAYALSNGYNYFAVQDEKECFTAIDAGETYTKYGTSEKCGKNGIGAGSAQNVFKVTCNNYDRYEVSNAKERRQELGCWADKDDRAINFRISGSLVDIKQQSYSAVDLCQAYALAKGHRVFAVESDDECFTGNMAEIRYRRHGGSQKCSGGVGGSWAMTVYRTDIEQDEGEIYVGNEGTKYIPGPYNTKACADNARLNGKSCNEAALVLGQGEKAKITYERNRPSGCMMYRGKIYYNSFYGQADDSSTPFCEYRCPVKHVGCFKIKDVAENQFDLDEYSGWNRLEGVGGLSEIMTCENIANDQGRVKFALRSGSHDKKSSKCITDPSAIDTSNSEKSNDCENGIGSDSDEVQSVYQMMCPDE